MKKERFSKLIQDQQGPEILAVLKDHYQFLTNVYEFYSCCYGTTSNCFQMSLFAFNQVLAGS
jgi:hypothetical protein